MSYTELGTDLFEGWSLAWLALREEVGREHGALAALAAAERGRAQALLELLRTPVDSTEAAANPVIRGPGADLAAEGRALASAAVRSGNAALSYLVTADTLIAWLVQPSGEVRVARRTIPRDSLTALVGAFRDRLGADEAAVRSRLALRATQPLELTPPEDQRGLGLGIKVAGSLAAISERLATLLLPREFLDQLPASGELIVVPHDALALLPFGALPSDSAGAPLGLRHPLRYAPSLATLTEVETRGEPGVAGEIRRGHFQRALVVGDPRMPTVRAFTGEDAPLRPLPAAGAEGRWLAERLGTEPLTGAEATEGAVRERLPDASLIHLATHGYAYSTEARARDSFIALAPGAEHDGLLTVGEVLDEVPRLSAELVVLSACQTGLGNLRQAEGTVGLQRAFLARGARSVLVSLWSVSDEATKALMKAFYTHWLEDPAAGKAEALRRAQQDVRSTPGWEHPRFWAAFQLVGAR